MKKYLVLGSSGFIGKSLCKYLKSLKHEVVEYDIKNSDEEDLRKFDNLKLVNLVASCDFVFFLAFDVGGSKYLADCDKDFSFLINNTRIISNTFEVLNNSGKKFLFVSTYLAKNLDHSYGLLKKIGEHFTCSIGGLIVRLYNIYGNEEVSERSHVIPDLIYQAKTQNCISLKTNGNEVRQFLYIEDCCKGLYVISENYNELLKQNLIIDLTSFEWISVKTVAEIVSENFNSKLKFSTCNADYNSKCFPNEVILNYWKPTTKLKDGISKMILEL